MNIQSAGLYDAAMASRGVKAADPMNPIDGDLAHAVACDADEAAAIIGSWMAWQQDRIAPIGGG